MTNHSTQTETNSIFKMAYMSNFNTINFIFVFIINYDIKEYSDCMKMLYLKFFMKVLYTEHFPLTIMGVFEQVVHGNLRGA